MRKYFFFIVLLTACVSQHSIACAAHLSFDPDNYGFFGRTLIKLAGLAPPEPVVKLDHVPTTMVALNEDSTITIDYKRPWRSKDVSIQLAGSRNIELQNDNITLEKTRGSVEAKFRLKAAGYNNITLTITGNHKGKPFNQVSRVFVGARKLTASTNHNESVRADESNHRGNSRTPSASL